MSLNSVNDLLFDKQGFLWVTTADGLQRFDGYRFQTFKHDPQNKKSIPENSVSQVYEDDNNNLWITHRTGLCFKPKGKNEFIDITSTLPAFTTRFPLSCVNETDDAIWVISFPSGVYAINKTSLQVKKISSLSDFSDKDFIYHFTRFRVKGDKVWFKKGSDLDADIYFVSNEGFRHFVNSKKVNIHYLIPGQKDSIVIISDKLIYKALENDPFTPLRIIKSSLDTLVFEDQHPNLSRKISNDRYILPGVEKTFIYDANKEAIIPFPTNQYFTQSLMRYLHASFVDQHQNSWIGFNGLGGIKVMSLQKFNLFNRPDKDALTYTLTGDQQGKIYAGIFLGDIEVYDKEGHFLQKIKLPEAHKKKGSPRAMTMIDPVTLIVRSNLNELYSIDTRSGSLKLLSYLLPPRPDSATKDFESGMQAIGKNEIWFSYSNSILSLKKNKERFTCTNIYTLPANEHIICFFHNSADQTWLGTVNGLWVYEKNKLTKIPLPVTYIKHINQNPDGRIWATTMNGILIVENNRVIKHLNTKDGLQNSFVYSVLFDDNGNAWISTNRGIAKISPSNSGDDTTFIVTSYSAKEGLQGDEFNTKGYYKAADGTLYFAGVNGINFFKPQNLVSKSAPSPTMLTEIAVNNNPYLPDLQPEFISIINLPNDQNNIRLSFSCMDFTVPEKNQYKFWLKGFQDDWSLPQINNTVQYILPPGDYELHVLGANYEGVWSKEPLILKINILPPWYLTNWAITIFAILILGFVASVFYIISRNRYRKRLRQLQMAQEIQKEKQRLSRDLHDNLGSQITWLSNNISQLEKAEQQEVADKRINQIKEGTGELMQTLRETIWILNKDKISCVDLFDKVVSLAARHIDVCPPLQLLTEENIKNNIELSSGQALQIFRICQEAINNACKHAQATVLTIKSNSAKDHFSISVSDNGKGFIVNENGIEGHYGLQNMKERAKESNLDLRIESSLSEGTIVNLSI
ncbi:MAG TPA: two-component regulator propeller domain-containing protein [Chitinophagaceae bacterium]|nr:two-component regulator propeller domain-containing protein [Chitinophagaceae bacterium]